MEEEVVEAEAEVVVPVEEPVKATPTPKKKGRPRKIRPEETPEAEKTPEAADGAEQQVEAMAAPETPVTPSRRGRKRKASAGAEEVSPEKKVTIVRTPEATFTKRRRRGMTSKTKKKLYSMDVSMIIWKYLWHHILTVHSLFVAMGYGLHSQW